MDFLTIVDIIFYISPQTGNLQSREISNTKFCRQLNFLANGVIYFRHKLTNQIKNSNRV